MSSYVSTGSSKKESSPSVLWWQYFYPLKSWNFTIWATKPRQTLILFSLTPLLTSWHLTTWVELIIYFNANEKRMKPGVFQTTGKMELMNLGASKRLIKDEADNTHNHRYHLKFTFLQSTQPSPSWTRCGQKETKGGHACRGSTTTKLQERTKGKRYSQSTLSKNPDEEVG